MVQYRSILTMTDQQEVVYDLSHNDFEQRLTQISSARHNCLSNVMHRQNINLPVCVCLSVCVSVSVTLSVNSPTGQTL